MKEMEGLNILTKLDAKDREKIIYFANLLLKQKKYQKLKEEIEERKRKLKEEKFLLMKKFGKN